MKVVRLTQSLRETRLTARLIAKNTLQACRNKLEACTDLHEAELLNERVLSLESEYAAAVRDLDEVNRSVQTLQDILLRQQPPQQYI